MKAKTNHKLKVILAILNLVFMILCIAYFIHGSLERWPTEEQQGGIRIAMGLVITISVIIEFVLFTFIRKKS